MMEYQGMKIVETPDIQVQLPLQISDIVQLLRTQAHRLRTYIADPRLNLNTDHSLSKIRNLKVDNIPVPFLLCLQCREVFPSSPSVIKQHKCATNIADDGAELPVDETWIDDESNSRLMKTVKHQTKSLIQQELRSCFNFSMWADVTLISANDNQSVKVHSAVLASSCSMLRGALEDLSPFDLDEIFVIVANTAKDELDLFIDYIYGNKLDVRLINSPFYQWIDFEYKANEHIERRSEKQSQIVTETFSTYPNDEYSVSDNVDHYMEDFENAIKYDQIAATTAEDIKKLMEVQPYRISFKEAQGHGRQTKVWKSYNDIIVDNCNVPFVQCKTCEDIFEQTATDSTTIIKQHAKTHNNTDKSDIKTKNPANFRLNDVKAILKDSPGRVSETSVIAEDDVALFKMCQTMEYFKMLSIDGVSVPFVKCTSCGIVFAHSSSNSGITALKKHAIFHNKNKEVKLLPTKKKQPKWIKPTNSNLSQFGEDNKIELKTPEPIHNRDKDDPTSGPGVSKFAIIQMIQDGSNRIHFEESQTHSAVWEKFLKIVLDNSEVPFVCCKYCKKVYTHDRTLGTSSLIRHQCGEEPNLDKLTKSGGIPKLLVQELVNTKSDRVSMTMMKSNFNQKLDDVTQVFDRVKVDEKETDYICCRYCNKLYVLSNTKISTLLVKKIEVHDCYIKNASHIQRVQTPKDERDCLVIYIREPHRIVLQDKVNNEPNLHYFLLDGNKTNFAHCTKCRRFFALSSLNTKSEDRIHRCHKAKTADHNIHFKKKVFVCDKCDNNFKSEHFLEIHKRKEHGEGSATVMCSHCAKEFPTERLAKKHELNVHYPEISKKYACKECDATFHDRSKLRLHSLKHSKIKPYVCEQCGKGFNWIASFQDHMDMHNGIKKYSCDFCPKKFNKRNTLNNHKRLHTGEKPFICPSPGCGMTFVQRTACKTHAKKRHNIEITIYPRNPDCPQSEASLAQLSLSQRLEQQHIQERLQQQVPQLPAQPSIQLSRAQLAQLTTSGGQVLTIIPEDQLTQIRLLDAREVVEVTGMGRVTTSHI